MPLLIQFLPGGPAGAMQMIPFTPNTLEMQAFFVDLTNATSATLTVPADQAAQHGGIAYVLIRPAGAGGVAAPVAVTAMRVAPLK